MRHLPWAIGAIATGFQVVFAATPPQPVAQPPSSGTSTSSVAAKPIDPTVLFLQSLQAAQISSMTCLIALVTMTTQPVGQCLGLTQLTTLLYSPTPLNGSADFGTSLGTYLSTACAGAACSETALADGRSELQTKCSNQRSGGLVPMLDMIMTNYAASYKTLGCSVRYNGTADNCLSTTISSSQAANNPQFFVDLAGGGNLGQYASSVFRAVQCTGCIHELYKAAVFLIPAIRNQGITQDTGNHLRETCGAGPPNWANVMDQQIPESLTVQQATPGRASGARGVILDSLWQMAAAGVAGVGIAVLS